MKNLSRFVPLLLLFANVPAALACSCISNSTEYPDNVLIDFVAEHYGKAATYKIDHKHVHQDLADKVLYILDGSPDPKGFGANCWYLNDIKQPISDCTSSYKITYDVTVSLVAETCTQTITIATSENSRNVKFTPPVCKND